MNNATIKQNRLSEKQVIPRNLQRIQGWDYTSNMAGYPNQD
jgi:hypothetical protein